MKKKILLVSIVAIFMLVTISFSTVVSSNTTTDEKRESPLFRVRTRKAIGERLDELKDVIKAKFVGDKVFFLPFNILSRSNNLILRDQVYQKIDTGWAIPTCPKWSGSWNCCNIDLCIRDKLMEKEPTSGVCTHYGQYTCQPGCTIFQPGC